MHMSNQKHQPGYKKNLRRLAVAVAAILLLAAGAIVMVNLLVLPGVAARLERSMGSSDIEVRIGGLRYWPLYGIVARSVAIGGDVPAEGKTTESGAVLPGLNISSVECRISRIRVPSPESLAIRWIRASGADSSNLRNFQGVSARFAPVEQIAVSGLLPKRVSVKGLELEARVPQQPSITLYAKSADLIHDSRSSAILAVTPESSTSSLAGNLRLDYSNRTATGNLVTGPLDLSMAPFSGGTALFDFAFRFEEGAPVDFSGTMTMTDAGVVVPAIAEEPIGPLNVHYDFEATYSQEPLLHNFTGQVAKAFDAPATIETNDKLAVTGGDLLVNDLALEFKPVLYGLADRPTPRVPTVAGLIVHLPTTDVQSIIRSVPEAVSGNLTNTKASGTIAWDLDLSIPIDEISRMQWSSGVQLDQFAVLQIDPAVNVYRMNDGFIHTIQDGPGYQRTVRIPPAKPASMEWMLEHSEHTQAQIEHMRREDREIATSRPPAEVSASFGSSTPPSTKAADTDSSYRYVYVDDMSPWIIRAVLTAEDGDFFFYDGINPVTFADAIALNVEAGEIRFGASTISMQLIKILFLDQKRIFARKIQEAFLVYLMEHHVPVSKDRILELYLNLAEFGPGIFGVSDAAKHYFDKSPSELTAGEATWLASILPSPKTYYRQFQDGAITDDGFRRMAALYRIMLERGRMTQDEYDAAMAGPPDFARR